MYNITGQTVMMSYDDMARRGSGGVIPNVMALVRFPDSGRPLNSFSRQASKAYTPLGTSPGAPL